MVQQRLPYGRSRTFGRRTPFGSPFAQPNSGSPFSSQHIQGPRDPLEERVEFIEPEPDTNPFEVHGYRLRPAWPGLLEEYLSRVPKYRLLSADDGIVNVEVHPFVLSEYVLWHVDLLRDE